MNTCNKADDALSTIRFGVGYNSVKCIFSNSVKLKDFILEACMWLYFTQIPKFNKLHCNPPNTNVYEIRVKGGLCCLILAGILRWCKPWPIVYEEASRKASQSQKNAKPEFSTFANLAIKSITDPQVCFNIPQQTWSTTHSTFICRIKLSKYLKYTL